MGAHGFWVPMNHRMLHSFWTFLQEKFCLAMLLSNLRRYNHTIRP